MPNAAYNQPTVPSTLVTVTAVVPASTSTQAGQSLRPTPVGVFMRSLSRVPDGDSESKYSGGTGPNQEGESKVAGCRKTGRVHETGLTVAAATGRYANPLAGEGGGGACALALACPMRDRALARPGGLGPFPAAGE